MIETQKESQQPSTLSTPTPTRTPRVEHITRFNRTNSGNAELFAALFGRTVRYDHASNRWLLWRDHWWSQDKEGEIVRLAKALARWRAQAAFILKEEERRTAEYKWAFKSESSFGLQATLKLAQSARPIADDGTNWDSNPMLLGVKNGIVDLKTGKLRRGQQSDRITLHTEIPQTTRARYPRWQRFLKEAFVDDELIKYIQKAVGYCLTGDTREQILFLCYGTGANGKSTFLDVLRYVLGPYAYNLPFSAFELESRSQIPNELAALVGKRFVTAIETNESAQLNESRIKTLTGSDPITARFLFHEFFTFNPTGKVWLAFNHKPRVSDDSPGFWRRVRLIPFTQQFGEGQRDPELMEKLKAEASGILNWAIEGALMWQRQGLKTPEVVAQASDTYREESDPLKEFLEECCVLHSDAQATVGEFRKAYVHWASVNEEPSLDNRAFCQKMTQRGIRKGRTGHKRTRTWLGVGLRYISEAPSSAGGRGQQIPIVAESY